MGGGIPACLAGFQAHTQGGSLGGSGWGGGVQAHTQGGSWGGSGPGPHPRGKLRGIWSRPTPKGEVEGDLARGVLQGCLLWGGGVSAPWGVCSGGVLALGVCVETPLPSVMATAAGGTHPTEMHSCFNLAKGCRHVELMTKNHITHVS